MKPTRFGDYEKVVRFPVFCNYRVHVVVTDDVQKSHSERKCGDDNDHAGVEALFCTNGKGPESYIFFQREASAGTIAHESWHAVRRMLLDIGSELDNEVVAYHHDYLVDAAFHFVWHEDLQIK